MSLISCAELGSDEVVSKAASRELQMSLKGAEDRGQAELRSAPIALKPSHMGSEFLEPVVEIPLSVPQQSRRTMIPLCGPGADEQHAAYAKVPSSPFYHPISFFLQARALNP